MKNFFTQVNLQNIHQLNQLFWSEIGKEDAGIPSVVDFWFTLAIT
jgi:hypothetical protein